MSSKSTKTKPKNPGAAKAEARESALKEWIKAIAFSVIFVVTFRGVVAQAYQIPTGSMEETLMVGDYLFINKMIYGPEIDLSIAGHRLFYYRFPGFRNPARGDIIVFRYPENPKQDFIKRCVAVGGQTVMIKDKILYIDGVPQREPYVQHIDPRTIPGEISRRDFFGPFTVPKGYVFMMGDNRDNSHDSRFWGPLDVGLIRGQAFVRYFSWDGENHSIRFNRMFQGIS
ncbi:MAG: signal peptidase I [Candidatus Eiseniibacteriota bacterium]